MAQVKEQIKTPGKNTTDKEIANLSDARFKRIIRMLTEMLEYGPKIEEKVKAINVKERKMYREPTVTGRNQDSNQWFGPEGRNQHLTRTE